MRSYIRTLLFEDNTLRALGVSVVSAGDIDTPKERPFINLKWGVTTAGLRGTRVNKTQLAVWVHDEPNDYRRISDILYRCYALLIAVEGQHWVETDPEYDGYITLVEYNGESADLSDDGHGTIVRQGNYTIVGN